MTKYRIRLVEGEWHCPDVKTLWGWKQISGGRLRREDAIAEIGKHALGETTR